MARRLPERPASERLTFADAELYDLEVWGNCEPCRHVVGISTVRGRHHADYRASERSILWLWGNGYLACHKCGQPYDTVRVQTSGGTVLFPSTTVARWWVGMGIPAGTAAPKNV